MMSFMFGVMVATMITWAFHSIPDEGTSHDTFMNCLFFIMIVASLASMAGHSIATSEIKENQNQSLTIQKHEV